MNEYKELINKTVIKLFLVVWSPWGEKRESDIDISFGFVFENDPNRLCLISVDKNELWTPRVLFESLPINNYLWEDFYPRIKMWMKAEDENSIIGLEYYDVTSTQLFRNIIGYKIEMIELIKVNSISNPFGIKIHFKDDYIISFSNGDGNTVETKCFNKNNGIEFFKIYGEVIYLKV